MSIGILMTREVHTRLLSPETFGASSLAGGPEAAPNCGFPVKNPLFALDDMVMCSCDPIV